ncbi:MAG: tetratricopeptide repeat protein [Planctomycetaceae bacterium]|nr:tetratricopeptide repeat protein [Planctomycetaceae bacterium]
MNIRKWLVVAMVGASLLAVRSSLGTAPEAAGKPTGGGDSLKEKSSSVDEALAAYSSYWDQAEKYETQGNLDKAIASWTAAIHTVPPQAEYFDIQYAYYARAWLHGKKGDLDKAIGDYSAAIRQDPRNVVAYCCRAGLYDRKGDLDKAIADLSTAADIRSDNAYPLAGRARLRVKKGDLDRAVADCNEAIKLKPDFAAAFHWLASAYLAKGETEKAISAAAEAIGLDSKKAAFYEVRSLANAKKGNNRRAAEDHDAAVRLAGKIASASLDVAAFEIVKNADGFLVFADHRCSRYVPSVNYRNVSASFSDAQVKEMAKTSLDHKLFLQYIEIRWPLDKLKIYCTPERRFPDTCQNLVGDTCFPETLTVHAGHHDGFDKISVYACHDEGMDGKCSYAGSLMSDWRRWDYSLNMIRGKDHWVIIESLPNDFMDNPSKYLPRRIETNSADKQAKIVAAVVEKIKPLLPTGWSVRKDGNVFTIRRDKPIEWYGTISLPSHNLAYLKNHGFIKSGRYTITLEFFPPLSKAAVDKLVEDNRRIEKQYYQAHPQPKNDKPSLPWELEQSLHHIPDLLAKQYSVLVTPSINGWVAFYDEQDKKECEGVEQNVRRWLKADTEAPSVVPDDRASLQGVWIAQAMAINGKPAPAATAKPVSGRHRDRGLVAGLLGGREGIANGLDRQPARRLCDGRRPCLMWRAVLERR